MTLNNCTEYTVHSFPDWEKDDQYNGSPPRPAPRGPRTPPGPPPPDDDEEEQVPVAGQILFSLFNGYINS